MWFSIASIYRNQNIKLFKVRHIHIIDMKTKATLEAIQISYVMIMIYDNDFYVEVGWTILEI